LKFSPFNFLPLRWGRMKVGVDKTNLVPLPFIPSRQGRGDFLGGQNVRDKFSDFNV